MGLCVAHIKSECIELDIDVTYDWIRRGQPRRYLMRNSETTSRIPDIIAWDGSDTSIYVHIRAWALECMRGARSDAHEFASISKESVIAR